MYTKCIDVQYIRNSQKAIVLNLGDRFLSTTIVSNSNTGMDYRTFIESKAIVAKACGIDAEVDNPALFPFQQHVVKKLLKLGRGAGFESTGLGKSRQEIEWANQVNLATGDRVLMLAPLAVAKQTTREAEKIGISIKYVESMADVEDGISITNYEKLHKFNPCFGGIVLDECFAKGTPVDVFESGVLTTKPIESIRVGDRILNASGIDIVADIHRREVEYAVKLSINGKEITCSPNHPFFTQYGWVGAQDLTPAHKLMHSTEAVRYLQESLYSDQEQSQVLFQAVCKSGEKMRVVRQNIPTKEKGWEVLRSILLSEMANESASSQSKGSHAGSHGKNSCCTQSMDKLRCSVSDRATRKDSSAQSNEQSRNPKEVLPPIERSRAQTFRAWGEWDWFDSASTDFTGCIGERLDSGICFIVGETDSRLSNTLQTRLSQSRSQNWYRGGWSISSQQTGARSEERCEAGFSWVDSLEVLESGNPELERLRDEDGRIYLYDLGATRHPSFSVHGVLVHNSSLIKSQQSKTFESLCNFSKGIPFRSAWTATPSPNDYMEFGTQAEFLGIMKRDEMLATFFRHDGGENDKWILSGHGESKFWEWLCSWSIALKMPSDLGFSDDGYILPPLTDHHHIVDGKLAPQEGELFAIVRGLSDRRKARQASIEERVAIAAELANNSNEQWLIFCDYNAEGDALEKLIPDAIQVKGGDKDQFKEDAMIGFADGSIRVLVSKSSICGFGMNFQKCRNVCFVGISDSWESMVQATARVHRFGQEREVNRHFIFSNQEDVVWQNLKRKQGQADLMWEQCRKYMQFHHSVEATSRQFDEYNPTVELRLPNWIKGEVA